MIKETENKQTLIDNDYIIRIIQEIDSHSIFKNNNRLSRIKYGMPLILRKIVFSALNPLYVYYIYFIEKKWQKKVFKNRYINFSIDFVNYCYTHKIDFDLNRFYPAESQEVILNYIRNRVKSCFNVDLNKCELLNDRVSLSHIDRSRKKLFTKRLFNGYSWNLDDKKYYIPHLPEHSTWYFNMGLDALPQTFKENLRGKSFLDLGAYWGDTTLKMLVLEPKDIWAFEPDENNFQLLEKVISINALEDICKAVKLGAGSENRSSYITSNAASSKINDQIGQKIELVSIDLFVKERRLEVGLIKMDIEGNEYDAIIGAEQTIKSFKPLLIISLYHTGKDFFEIPPLLKSWNDSYNFRFFNASVEDLSEKLLIAF